MGWRGRHKREGRMRSCFLNKNVEYGQSTGGQRDGLNVKMAACIEGGRKCYQKDPSDMMLTPMSEEACTTLNQLYIVVRFTDVRK